MKRILIILLCCSLLLNGEAFAKKKALSHAEEAFQAGEAAYDRKEYQKAIYAFQHATQYDPEHYEAFCMLGLMYLLNDEINRGVNMLTYATQVFPKKGYAFALLGDYYQTQKKTDLAIEYYQKALDLPLPKGEKKIYTERLKELTEAKEEIQNLQTAAARDIIQSIRLPDTNDWVVSHAQKQKDNWIITYRLKDEDLMKDDWTQKITLKCMMNKIGSKPFKSLFSDITNSFIERGISVANVDPGFRSASFTTSEGDNRSVVYVFPRKSALCIAERVKRERWKSNEPARFLEQLQGIRIIGDE